MPLYWIVRVTGTFFCSPGIAAVIVRVYTPDGVVGPCGGLDGGVVEPPVAWVPHAMGTSRRSTTSKAGQPRIDRLLFLNRTKMHGNSAASAMLIFFHETNEDVAEELALEIPVTTVTVANPVDPPVTGSIIGFTVQVAFCGTPVQPIVKVPLEPFTEITWAV